MSKLIWDKVSERLYETGVKNGVLYVQNSDGTYPLGVAWNGLSAITESPSGAEASPIYADDTKYLNLISAEEFAATIEAFTYPDEFAECDGSVELSAGVRIGQQNRKAFGMCYKTTLGNDVDGNDYGYKLHIIYGALAAPSEKGYQTINDSPEAIAFSWEVNTTPVEVTDQKPTATIVIDSTKVNENTLAALELILYGDTGVDPRLPLPDEIAALFVAGVPSAISLSSIVPADDATGIAIDANIVITFNNKIDKESILIASEAGVLVAAAKSWDTAGKVLTINPNSNLSTNTVYIVAIAGVVDIYNQALAAAVKNFTTTA